MRTRDLSGSNPPRQGAQRTHRGDLQLDELPPLLPPVPVDQERNKEKKRDALVRAGRALFLAKGFDETTTRAIAAKAGVASGTFFLYFREKRDLLFHLFQEEVSGVQAEAFATSSFCVSERESSVRVRPGATQFTRTWYRA